MKLELCSYSGLKVYPGHGKKFVRVDGKVFQFLNSKCERSHYLKRNPRKVNWTVLYRRKHKKGLVEESQKKRTRRNTKFTRAIAGLSLNEITAKRNQKPEFRKAQREQAIRAAKEKNRAKEIEKKAKRVVRPPPKAKTSKVIPKTGGRVGTNVRPTLLSSTFELCCIRGPLTDFSHRPLNLRSSPSHALCVLLSTDRLTNVNICSSSVFTAWTHTSQINTTMSAKFQRSCALLLLLVLIAFLPANALGSSDPCNLMTTGKNCFCSVRRITCSKTTLPSIPNNFPRDTSALSMDGNRFAVPILRRSNISYLTELRSLSFKDCGLQSLEVGVFSDLKKLTYLDLSSNNIKRVPSHTFLGVNLKYLMLNENRGIRLTRDSFEGMRVEKLSLVDCELNEVNYFTFLPLNSSLTGLWLNKNNLRTLDPRFERLGSHLKHFKVDDNPLRCGCQLRWLVSYLRRQSTTKGPSMSLAEDKSPTCASPENLREKRIRDLKPHQLTCDPPQLRNADVLLGEKRSGRLICRASGYPTPVITWSRVYPSLVFLQKFPPLSHFASASRQLNQASVKVKGQANYEEYLCSAANDGGHANLTVRLNWAKTDLGVKEVETRDRDRGVSGFGPNPGSGHGSRGPGTMSGGTVGLGTNINSNNNNQPRRPNFDEEMTGRDYLFRRQFSLLELIGAVVGTFTGTLGLFVLIYWFISRSKKKEKKRTFSQYMYESAYSGSHEYDVPRLEHPAPPPPFVAPKPPGADGMEFLDYKTHRKLYNQV